MIAAGLIVAAAVLLGAPAIVAIIALTLRLMIRGTKRD